MSNIIIARTREIDAGVARVSLEGWVTLELRCARSGLIKRRLRFRNLITDAGMNGLGNVTTLRSIKQYAAVGTSNTAPAVGQTTLVAEVAGGRPLENTGASTTGVAAGNEYHWRKTVYTFLEAQGNGDLREIGLFTAPSAGTMWMRQLITDPSGVPLTLTKTSSEQLQVTYEIRVYPPTSDTSGTVAGYDWVTRAMQIDTVGGSRHWGPDGMLDRMGEWNAGASTTRAGDVQTLGATTDEPANTQSDARTSAIISAYGAGNFYRDIEHTWGTGDGNFTGGGIGNFIHLTDGWGNPKFQTSFTPKIPKTNLQVLKIMQRYSWARHP